MTTWTPVTEQIEAWTSEARPLRVFDPHVFDRSPIFDTGASVSGIWDVTTTPSEVWIPE